VGGAAATLTLKAQMLSQAGCAEWRQFNLHIALHADDDLGQACRGQGSRIGLNVGLRLLAITAAVACG
jgi:hypothetical protein